MKAKFWSANTETVNHQVRVNVEEYFCWTKTSNDNNNKHVKERLDSLWFQFHCFHVDTLIAADSEPYFWKIKPLFPPFKNFCHTCSPSVAFSAAISRHSSLSFFTVLFCKFNSAFKLSAGNHTLLYFFYRCIIIGKENSYLQKQIFRVWWPTLLLCYAVLFSVLHSNC